MGLFLGCEDDKTVEETLKKEKSKEEKK